LQVSRQHVSSSGAFVAELVSTSVSETIKRSARVHEQQGVCAAAASRQTGKRENDGFIATRLSTLAPIQSEKERGPRDGIPRSPVRHVTQTKKHRYTRGPEQCSTKGVFFNEPHNHASLRETVVQLTFLWAVGCCLAAAGNAIGPSMMNLNFRTVTPWLSSLQHPPRIQREFQNWSKRENIEMSEVLTELSTFLQVG
jgi:hypothetical protein